MRYVAYESRMAKMEDGIPHRAWVEASAAKGNAEAIAELEAPVYPEELEYLRDWSREVVGRSGVAMDGYAPLSWECLRAWSDATGHRIEPDEASALMLLDGAMRHPEDVSLLVATPDEQNETSADTPAWPQ